MITQCMSENELEDAMKSGCTSTDLPIVSGIMMLSYNFFVWSDVLIYIPPRANRFISA